MLHIARKCRRALIAALTVMALTITPLCALGDAEEAEYSYEYDDMSVRFLSGDLMTTADGSPAIVLRYDFTNSRTKAESFVYAFAVTVYQGGIECDPAYSWDFAVAPDDAYTSLLSVKDGATMQVAKYFRLHNDTSPVDVELTRMFAFGSQPLTMTLTLPDVTVSSTSIAQGDSQEIVIDFATEEAQAITAAALLEGKTPSQWLHDIAMESIGADKTDE